MLLGSHNSLSYLPPKKWYLKPFHFLARCQSVDYVRQYEEYGIRLFDIRLWFNEKGEIEVRHGLFVFDIDIKGISDFLSFLNKKGDCYLRIILEEDAVSKKYPYAKISEMKFLMFCERLEEAYKHIKFFGGNRKYDWIIVHHFKTTPPQLVDMYSSTTRFIGKRDDSTWFQKLLNIVDDWCPWFYAKKWNKKNFSEFKEKDKFLFFDFVQMR